MFDLKFFIFIFISTLISIFPSITSQKPYCNQTCSGTIHNDIPYPIGFSSGCEIQLNCTPNGTVLIEDFTVHQIKPDYILVGLPAECGRAVETLHRLYGDHYAPTSDNAILMENCTKRIQTCSVPQSMMQPNLDFDCDRRGDDFGNVSCYSGDMGIMFLDYENVTKTGCRSLLLGMVVKIVGVNSAVSLNVQMVKLGWWLKGGCQCSDDAICTRVVSPVDGSDGYRCRCKDGYDGDGYKASSGCRPKGTFITRNYVRLFNSKFGSLTDH
ncbi:hypothetical protein HanPI659440_Chr02g0043801 [Helianthus annuus]|nr:hypothetical protein HanPI659440_Chr02g0043801 [Helianthus annuus]